MEEVTKWLKPVADALLSSGARSALKVISPGLVVQATRVMWNGKFGPKGNLDVRFTAGRPNYLARRFIRTCVKAGEPFPVKRIRLRMPPKRRA